MKDNQENKGRLKIVGDIADKAAHNYFIKLAEKQETHKKLSTKEKIEKVKKIRQKSLIFAALCGTFGVIFLYLPQIIFPDLFPQTKYTIPYIDFTFDFSFSEMFYGFFLVGLEIWLLIRSDIKTVGKVAAVYGYKYREHSESNNEETTELVYIGIGKEGRAFTKVGINPFQNVSKTGVVFLRLVFLLKAFFSNFFFKIILKKVFGRIAVRTVVNFAGIPIYAAWNAYASSVVIRKVDKRMLARDVMLRTGRRFLDTMRGNEIFKKNVYDALGYIAVTKKNYYPSDYIFARHFLKIFDIKIQDEHQVPDSFIENLKNLEPDVRLAVGQLLVIGFLLDGKIGALEIRVLKKLKNEGIIPYTIEDTKMWTKRYLKGEGFYEMFDYVPASENNINSNK